MTRKLAALGNCPHPARGANPPTDAAAADQADDAPRQAAPLTCYGAQTPRAGRRPTLFGREATAGPLAPADRNDEPPDVPPASSGRAPAPGMEPLDLSDFRLGFFRRVA
jgi:hypothetical protein